MFFSEVFARQLTRAADGEAGVVDAGGPPAEADASGGPDDFAEAGGVGWGEGGDEGVQAVVVFGGMEVFALDCVCGLEVMLMLMMMHD